MPVEEVGRIAQKNNLLFCVDAAQSAGTISVDVKKIGCHFMAFPASSGSAVRQVWSVLL